MAAFFTSLEGSNFTFPLNSFIIFCSMDSRTGLNSNSPDFARPPIRKMAWGLVPYVQSLLLARYLRGDLEDYPPFLWK